ncbi:GumC family protein [Methylosinus sp. Sm6]|uniref:GumC family protein n=1 Tax=Methylosinus sp. Sm6 TaxID=2866948 RepID=UPI002105F4A7|nr:polysaccharide biosynthesis tyrosine autokinase [Methylosinus sp. Sm6]
MGGDVPAVILDETSRERNLAAAGAPLSGFRDDGYGGAPDDIEALQFLKLYDIILKYKKRIAMICAAFSIVGFVVTFLMPRIYTATTTIQIDREAAKVLRLHDAIVENSSDPQFYETQYELLRSRALAERVVSSLSLADRRGFGEGESWSLSSAIRKLFSQKRESAPDVERLRERAVELVMNGLTVQPVAKSRIVKVGFSSRDPAIAQEVSSAIGQNFVAMTLDRRYGASAYARQFLEDKLQQVKVKLEDSEKLVVDYAQREGIVNVDDKISTSGANLKTLNDSLAVSTAERIKSERLWAQAQAGNGVGLPQVLEDRNIQSARDRRAQLMAEFQDKLSVMKPDFPEMRQLRGQIAEYDRQISAQVSLIKQAIKARYEAARDQEISFREQIERLKADVLDLRGRSIQYNILQRELDTNRSLYDGLLQQYKEVGITGAIGTSNVSIIDRAELPKGPSSPKLLFNLGLALALGVLASAGAIIVGEIRDDTLKVPEDVEETLGLAVLGVIPVGEKDGESRAMARMVIETPLSAAAEAFRSLSTSLQFTTETGLPRTLLVTSAQAAEGKSTTSVCVASNFAQLGMRVLLIDSDLRNPSLHKIFGLDNDAGLSNVLIGTAQAEEVAIETCLSGATVLLSGPAPPYPAELLAGAGMGLLLARTREKFDIVIVDGPPVVGLADAPLIGHLVDGTILVVSSRETRKRVVRAALKRLYFSRTRLLGAVMNRFDAKKAGHSYGYGFGYAYDAYGLHDYRYGRLTDDARK